MSELERPIRQARRRLRVQRFVSALVWSLTATLAVAAVLCLAEKLNWITLPGPWWAPIGAACGLAALVAIPASFAGGPSQLEAALVVDRLFGLSERLSTALSLPPDLRATPAGEALIADARRHAAEIDVADRMTLARPRAAWAPIVPALLAFGVVALPEDLLERSKLLPAQPSIAKPETRKAIQKAVQTLSQSLAKKRKELDKLQATESGKLMAEIEKKLEEMSKSPPADKQKALIELNKLADKVQDRRKEVGSSEQIQRQLEQLRELTSGGPAEEFARELAKGEFGKAAQELKKLQEKMASNKLTEKERQELTKQLGDLKKQLDKMANLDERRKQLEEAKKNGMVSEQQYQEQKQKLDQQAKSMQSLQKLAEKLGEAQQQMSQGNQQQAAQTLSEAAQQVGEMSQELEQLESIDGAMADLQDLKNAINGEGMNQLGRQLEGMGQGMGNRPGNGNGLGRGRGQGDRPEAPDDTAAYDSKVKQQITKGKAMLGGFANPAKQVRGESILEVQGNVEAAVSAESEAITDQKIPNALRKHVQGYFDQVRKGE